MAERRATAHNGRKRKDGKAYNPKHNDRNEIGYDEHINPELTPQNHNWRCFKNVSSNLEAEQLFYEKHFGDGLQARNDNYVRQRHPERVQTIDDYRENPRNAPEETIWQVGNLELKELEGATDPALLWKIVTEQISWEQKTFPQVRYLDVDLHVDETNCDTHIHGRKVWIAHDDAGNEIVGQAKALEEMGVELPVTYTREDAIERVSADTKFWETNPSEKEVEKKIEKTLKDMNSSRTNNRKMTYTEACRSHYVMLCQKYGLDIELTPKEASRVGLDFADYKKKTVEEKVQILEQKVVQLTASEQDKVETINHLQETISDMQSTAKELQEAITDLTESKEVEEDALRKTNQALVKAKAKLEQIPDAEGQLQDLKAQIHTAAEELFFIMQEKEKAAKVKKVFGDKEVVEYHKGMYGDITDIAKEIKDHLEEAVEVRDDIAKRESSVARKEHDIEPVYRNAKKLQKEAEEYKQEQESYILGTAQTKAEKMVQEILKPEDKDGYTERMEKFLDSIQMQSGESGLEMFKAEELERAERIRERSRSHGLSL